TGVTYAARPTTDRVRCVGNHADAAIRLLATRRVVLQPSSSPPAPEAASGGSLCPGENDRTC
ncbi:MAG: hypothetical protein AB7V39_21340, partial [Nitrospiraceae bacterium]